MTLFEIITIGLLASIAFVQLLSLVFKHPLQLTFLVCIIVLITNTNIIGG